MEEVKTNTNDTNKPNLECFICLSAPRNPVATQCGHIFCWRCLKSWLNSKDKLSCPVCKNGIEMEKIIRLYVTNAEFDNEMDDIPKQDRINPQVNRNKPSFVKIIIYLLFIDEPIYSN